MTRWVRLDPKKKPPPWYKMIRRDVSPPAGKINSPSQGPQFTRLIWTFSATGNWPATPSIHALISAGVAFAGGGFWALISRIAASCCFDISVLLTPISRLDIGVTADLQVGDMTSFRERLLAIMLMGYETEFHSQARRARRRGGVPERRPAPQFSQSGRRPRGDSIGDQSHGPRTRGTRRCSAFPTHDSQCRPD